VAVVFFGVLTLLVEQIIVNISISICRTSSSSSSVSWFFNFCFI